MKTAHNGVNHLQMRRYQVGKIKRQRFDTFVLGDESSGGGALGAQWDNGGKRARGPTSHTW